MALAHDLLEQLPGGRLAQVQVDIEQSGLLGVPLVAGRNVQAVTSVECLDRICIEIRSLVDDEVDPGLNLLERGEVEFLVEKIAKSFHEPAIECIEIVLR